MPTFRSARASTPRFGLIQRALRRRVVAADDKVLRRLCFEIDVAILSCHVAITSGAVLVVFVLIAGGCSRREEPAPQPQFRPTATVKDIMTSIVDPESDVLWNAVATIVSLTGTEEREPKTDEEWAAVDSAVQLVKPRTCCGFPAVWSRSTARSPRTRASSCSPKLFRG